METVQAITVEQRLGLLTAENLKQVTRQIEILLASQSSHQ
jgi:hypothetical protein